MTNQAVFAQARTEGRTLLNEVEAKEILAAAGVPVSPTALASSPQDARQEADRVGYPVVLKVVSPDIAHKSDVGGVQLDLRDGPAVETAYAAIIKSAQDAVPGADIRGVAVQHMEPSGTEVIVGLTTDAQFGPVIMFGLGGIFVEVLKDVSFRIVPVTPADAENMMNEITARAVLDGVRGQSPVDRTAIRDLIVALSDFAEAHPEVREVDLNPVLAYSDRAIAVDARIVLAEAE